MALIVQKYGGTSMGSIDRIKNVAKRVKRWHDNGHQIVVVVSAMSGETNRLIDLARQISTQPDPREYDQMVSTGEQVSISLLAMAIKELGVGARSFTGRQVAIKTDNAHNKARIESIDDRNIREQLDAGNVVIVAGFQGIDDEGNATTLGRGGSDTTGVAIAAALGADECQIYTDVDGVYTTDRVTSKAKKLEKITFEEMLEMASLGSKILQIRSVEFAGKYGVPLRVLSSFDENNDGSFDQEFQDNVGTLITIDEGDNMEQAIISGIAFNRDEAKIVVRGVPDHPGIASAILSPIGRANIEIDMIVQNLSTNGTTDFTFTVNRTDMDKTMKVLENEVKDEIGAKEILANDEVVKVSLVAVGMRSHAGVASLMFQTLAENNINIQMISTSEIKVSVLIQEQYLEKAVKSLHTAFGLDREDGESKIAGL
ncbi:LOW QUALITY PROTEIN: aspartokinase [Psychrobacter sp. JCM 18903]|nr:LOW QUALITY PROTEIN: aspartokinase [Psychrobacter sp. JCM 18903]